MHVLNGDILYAQNNNVHWRRTIRQMSVRYRLTSNRYGLAAPLRGDVDSEVGEVGGAVVVSPMGLVSFLNFIKA